MALIERLAAWTYAPSWRDAVFFALAALGYGVVAAAPASAVLLLGVGLALALLTRAVGVGDLRPAAQRARPARPGGGAAAGGGLRARRPGRRRRAAGGRSLTGSLPAAALAGLVLAAAEAGVLIGFAAWRLAGRIDASRAA